MFKCIKLSPLSQPGGENDVQTIVVECCGLPGSRGNGSNVDFETSFDADDGQVESLEAERIIIGLLSVDATIAHRTTIFLRRMMAFAVS